MMAAVFIEPHERHDAIEAYRDRLSAEQIEQIINADEGAIIRLNYGIGAAGMTLTIIPEG